MTNNRLLMALAIGFDGSTFEQFGRELWLCAWMIGAAVYAEQVALDYSSRPQDFST